MTTTTTSDDTGPGRDPGRILLQAPPPLERREGAGGMLMNAVPMLGSLGSVALVATMGGANRNRGLLAAGLFLLAALGFVLVQVDRQHKQRTQRQSGSRRAYLAHLAGVRRTVRQVADEQRRFLDRCHPRPTALPALAAERTLLWPRPRDDRLSVRYGVRPLPLPVELVSPEDAPDEADPVCASALDRLLAVHRTQADLPGSVDLQACSRIEIDGPDAAVRALARAMTCSATAGHDPSRLAVAVLTTQQHVVHWEWVKWLPHARSTREVDAAGPRRMVTTDAADLAHLLPDDLPGRPPFGVAGTPAAHHVLLVVDGAGRPLDDGLVPPSGLQGVTVLNLGTRDGRTAVAGGLRLQLADTPAGEDRVPAVVHRPQADPVEAAADQLDLSTAEAFARRLAPLAEGRGPARTTTTGAVAELTDLLGLGDVRDYPVTTAWRPRPARDRLRVPVGLGQHGEPIHLDLKESAQEGMGPHGLCIGATGSGKSEFLRTLVLALAITHDPQTLNLVLVDFKGGATFAGMADLPHVSAVITNLADDLTLVDRMQDALSGEMLRRQELLRATGNHASVRDYEKARAAGDPLQPLPSLLIVVDEFSEMLTEKPELIDLFVAIGRLGRSLGLHLLLASQRLEEGRLRGLESHLSYRIGLRTFSAAESRTVLGVPDAYELPPTPGLGYLKPDQSTLLRFRASYVSGPPPDRHGPHRHDPGGPPGVLPFTAAEVRTSGRPPAGQRAGARVGGHAGSAATSVASDPGSQPSLLDVAVARMVGHGPTAHRVWLPPLDVPDTLDALMPDLAPDPELGLVSRRWREHPGLAVPLGTVDRPREQRRDTLVVDLSGPDGHVAVVGGPRSGKSTLLRTLVCGLALTTSPTETQFYVLDLGGGAFVSLADLPHVSGVATRSEPDVVRRVVAEVHGIVDHRERWFRQHGVDSIETYRARRDRGEVGDGWGDVFLVVDGWSTLRAEFDDLEMELQALAQKGLTFGVHLVTSATRWGDYRAGLRDVLGARLELRLGAPLDSEIDRSAARLVPTGRPGRGLVTGPLHFLAALPRIDGRPEPASRGDDGTGHLVERSAAVWRGPTGPKLRLLPDQVALHRVRELAAPAPDDKRLLLGLDERDLAPVAIDAGAEPHLLAFGDSGSGKSTLLRSYVHEVLRTRGADEAQIVVVDYRRSLLGEVPDDHLLHYLTSAAQAQPAITELAAYLENRLPGPDVTPEQLRNRSWWTGAHAFVVVDDHDLVATQQGSPLHPLVPLLAQARDIGLHLVVARRSGGASRALYEPVIQSLRDLAAPGVLLSGPREEGVLVGGLRPEPAAPGRARVVTRERGVQTVQLARLDPAN